MWVVERRITHLLVGARLAREGVVSVNACFECHDAFAGKPRSYKGLWGFEDQPLSGPFVITWLATDMHTAVVADFARAMHAAVVADFARAMYAAVVADFARAVHTVVVADFARAVYTVIVAGLRVSAAAPG